LHSLLPGTQFKFRQRLVLPRDFATDSQVATFTLIHSLHQNDKYLDLKHESITLFKLVTLQRLIEYHDDCLGKLPVSALTQRSHAFFECLNNSLDHVEDLTSLGWVVVDVSGDGNCGYYSIILGLENLGIFRHSVQKKAHRVTPMQSNTPWQNHVMELRHRLQIHSRSLMDREYPPGSRNHEWFSLIIGALSDNDFAEISDEFYTDALVQKKYFDETLTKKKVKGCPTRDGNYTMYQMSPYWGPYVASSLFSLRIIVYARTSTEGDDDAWSTTILHHGAPTPDDRIRQIPSLERMSDAEYKQCKTIELFYTIEYKGVGHFQFLRRILCGGSLPTTNASPESLMEILRRMPKNRSMTYSLQASPSVLTQRGKSLPKPKTLPKSKAKTASKHKKHNEPTMAKAIVPNEQGTDMECPKKRREPLPTQIKFVDLAGYEEGFYVRTRKLYGNFTRYKLCRNLEMFDATFLEVVRKTPNVLFGITPGDPIDDAQPPPYLTTSVPTIYQQHNNHYCLTYSLASCLFYCGFRWAGEGLSGEAERISKLPYEGAIKAIRSIMLGLVPVIGLPTLYGIRTKCHKRKKRRMTWEDLFQNTTPYPTLVIPLKPNGTTTHAFCVADDLIFDSTTSLAMKLCKESVQWLFQSDDLELYQVLRFNMKFSAPGCKIPETYQRSVIKHW